MAITKKITPTLAALTASAAAMPGISGFASAASPITEPRISISTSSYQEQAIDGIRTTGTDNADRYDIEVGQFQLVAPMGDNAEIDFRLAKDRMSGASPWFVVEGADGEPVQVMSGATIDDERKDASLEYKHFNDSSAISVILGISSENDYLSHNIGVVVDQELNNNNTTVSVGYSFSDDNITATDSELFFSRPEKENKSVQLLSLNVSHAVNKNLAFQTGLSYEVQKGFLSDPYKLVMVNNIPLADSRPDSRYALIYVANLRQYFPKSTAALKIDYRYYADNWGIDSHTLSLIWHQNLTNNWSVAPMVRYYKQNEADFFANYLVTAENQASIHHSSDYRLSKFDAVSYGLTLTKQIGRMGIELSAEQYESTDSRKPGDSRTSPGLVDFSLVSLSASYEF
ncbi:DUF3570 domain-containing protein [Motiliproteus sp. MSK22-1]|uniref:DUF3570 domain-containing protein n=1 Tax=Motiliproteus sp. MSK22-1 TaxID=1897630 RepID=UPI000977784C|nr:DUF3570 domain-containing protein [Motiliproteus sp. MSK22-1]OMH38049.1 hypothetical protein BGP75_07135 [Motiliproteus sp. MSK22-1]